MVAQGSFPITLDAAPERVWPWVADITRHAQWSPRPYRVELVSGEPNSVGARYQSVGWVPGEKDHEMDVEVTEVVPFERFHLVAHDALGDFDNLFTFRARGPGTVVTFRLEFPPMTGLAAFMVPLLFPLVGKADCRKRMRMLKVAVESAT
ncbi:MAG: SRPBCC family protein [Acidimicrobiales bacterium]